MTDYYDLAEEKGRVKLKNDFDHAKCKIYYDFTKDKYAPLDCFATACTPQGEQRMANEVKDRDIPVMQYAFDGLILELWKYNALMEAHDNSGYTPYYINYFQDARVIWDVSKLQNVQDRIITKECTKTTATNYGNRVPKKVILLYPHEGKITYYNN